MIADLTIHDKGDGNPHAHIMLTTRTIDGQEFGQKNRTWDKRENVELWREKYATLTNQYLEKYGHEARVTHLSYERQGLDQEPTIHLGRTAHFLEQQGVKTERGNRNRQIEARNQQREALKQELAELQRQQAEIEKEPEPETLIEVKFEDRFKTPKPLTPEMEEASRYSMEVEERKKSRPYRRDPERTLHQEHDIRKAEERAGEWDYLLFKDHYKRPQEPTPHHEGKFKDRYKREPEKEPEKTDSNSQLSYIERMKQATQRYHEREEREQGKNKDDTNGKTR
jgi:hypothetical protein